jgi:hypothetical protein
MDAITGGSGESIGIYFFELQRRRRRGICRCLGEYSKLHSSAHISEPGQIACRIALAGRY